MRAKFCKDEQLGEFILSTNASESKSPVISQTIHTKDPGDPLRYEVKRTGYYCVGTYAPEESEYKAVIEFRNAYGELPAAQIAKLPFYGGLTIVYAVIGMLVLLVLLCQDIAYIDSASGGFCMSKIAMIYVSSSFCKSYRSLAYMTSTRPKLHHCNHHIPHCRATYDMGLLW